MTDPAAIFAQVSAFVNTHFAGVALTIGSILTVYTGLPPLLQWRLAKKQARLTAAGDPVALKALAQAERAYITENPPDLQVRDVVFSGQDAETIHYTLHNAGLTDAILEHHSAADDWEGLIGPPLVKPLYRDVPVPHIGTTLKPSVPHLCVHTCQTDEVAATSRLLIISGHVSGMFYLFVRTVFGDGNSVNRELRSRWRYDTTRKTFVRDDKPN